MAATLSDLSADFLFRARNLYPATDYAAQKTWLWSLYEAAAALDGSEITATSFKGASSSAQFRGATPEDYRLALKSAIEQLEDTIAGATAAQFRKPFGLRWTVSPAEALG